VQHICAANGAGTRIQARDKLTSLRQSFSFSKFANIAMPKTRRSLAFQNKALPDSIYLPLVVGYKLIYSNAQAKIRGNRFKHPLVQSTIASIARYVYRRSLLGTEEKFCSNHFLSWLTWGYASITASVINTWATLGLSLQALVFVAEILTVDFVGK